MAKIKVHELAKELDKQSKDILSFLQEKGIEAKAAQSSIEEDAAQLVRKAFGKSAKDVQTSGEPAAKKPKQEKEPAEKDPAAGKEPNTGKKSEAQEPAGKAPKAGKESGTGKSAEKEPNTGKKSGAEKPAEKEPKAESGSKAEKESGEGKEKPVRTDAQNPKPVSGEKAGSEKNSGKGTTPVPKKKKNIIFVSNPQNSKMQGQRSGQGAGGNGGRAQGGQGNQGNQRNQQGQRAQGQGNQGSQRNQNQGGQGRTQSGYLGNRVSGRPQPPVRPIKPLTPPSPTPSVQMVPFRPQPKPRQEQVEKPETAVAQEAVQAQLQGREAAQAQTANLQESRPQEVKASEGRGQEGRSQEAKYQEGRPQETRNQDTRRQDGRSQEGRSSENRSQGFRSSENRSQGGRSQDGRSSGDRPFRDGRGQDNRGQDGRYQDNRNRDSRSQGGRSQDGRPSGDRPQRGQFQGRGGSGTNGRPSGDRQNGFQRNGRPGFDGASGDRRGPGSGQGGGRGFNGALRDNRGNAGSGNRFGDNRSGKGFAGEAPAKDMEKRRDEDKRRANSQEKDKRSRKDHIYEEDEALKNRPGRFIRPEKKKEEVAEEAIKVIILPEMITIKDLADKMKLQPSVIVKKLFLEGKIVTVNQEISYEDAENIAMEYDILCEREVKVDVIEELLKEDEEDESALVERPPVICVMGHVDHGKTSQLDAIRKTNVTDKEAGGITQHIGAYTVNVGGRKITFLDTPGHEAFTAMRMRGANSTDIAILVVAADDGVMPQTVEAISHAKAAGIEIVVAVNKIDKPSANIERVKQELTEYELIATDWGGSTEFVPVSAKSGEGVENLLETILLTADILELKANPSRRARGLVIEAELDKGRGPVATVLVQKGTLHVGDFISAGACHGKVRAMIDDKGRRVKEADPSTPVEILGLSDVPSAGEVFLAHDSDKTAKSYAETYLAQNKEKMLEETKSKMSLDDLFSQIKEGNLKELNLIVKADVQGSVEAVKQSLLKLSNEEVVVKCIHGGVGAINESDVTLASASNAIIIGFNVRPDATAKATAEREGVDVRLYRVIYQAIEDVEAAMKGMLDPVFEEKVIGHAEVRQIFKASQIGNIAGSYVMDGILQRGCKVRISREGTQIYEGALASLKRFKDDVKEVKEGFECGLVFEGFDQIQELDVVEAYNMVEVPR